MTELRKRLIIIMIYLLPFIVTVISVIFQKTGILAGGPGSLICFFGELAALLICGVFIFLREIKMESCPSLAAKTKTFCSVMLYFFYVPVIYCRGSIFTFERVVNLETFEPESLINKEPPKIPSGGKPNGR